MFQREPFRHLPPRTAEDTALCGAPCGWADNDARCALANEKQSLVNTNPAAPGSQKAYLSIWCESAPVLKGSLRLLWNEADFSLDHVVAVAEKGARVKSANICGLCCLYLCLLTFLYYWCTFKSNTSVLGSVWFCKNDVCFRAGSRLIRHQMVCVFALLISYQQHIRFSKSQTYFLTIVFTRAAFMTLVANYLK